MDQTRATILVADDDPFYLELAAGALKDAGFEVLQATDGNAALAKLSLPEVEAAVLDVTMPHIDGLEVIRRFRASGPKPFLPIIVITGQDDADAVESAFKAGATSFLSKPLNWALFVHHVQFVLRSAQSEADLREAERTAQVLSRLKSDLLAALANEFRGPLKTVQGFTELMRREVHGPIAPPIYKEFAGDMAVAAEQLNVALLKMLQFGRALSDSIGIHDEEIPVRDLVSSVLQVMRDRAERRGVVVDFEVQVGNAAFIVGDRALLSQAIKGLVENAVRFSPRGATVHVLVRLEADDSLSISVEDVGTPMPRHMILELLDPIAAARMRTNVPVDRGVGLSICKILAEAHQGELTIQPVGGEGNISRIALPSGRVVRRGLGVDLAALPRPKALQPAETVRTPASARGAR